VDSLDSSDRLIHFRLRKPRLNFHGRKDRLSREQDRSVREDLQGAGGGVVEDEQVGLTCPILVRIDDLPVSDREPPGQLRRKELAESPLTCTANVAALV
jgi:hypothetical protein